MSRILDLSSADVDRLVSETQERGEELSDLLARTVAQYWHSGQASAFYAFVSSDHYDRDALLRELSDTIAMSYDSTDAAGRLEFDMLGTYFLNRPQS